MRNYESDDGDQVKIGIVFGIRACNIVKNFGLTNFDCKSQEEEDLFWEENCNNFIFI